MNSNKNILRQIVDLQSQLEKAIQEKDELNSFETISKFNDEIKSFLLENISDEFILNHIKSIPSLSLIDLESSNSIGFIGFLAGITGLGNYYKSTKSNDLILHYYIELKGKYSSLEFLIKNYFN